MISRRSILRLLAIAVILPIALVLALGTARLLDAMGDAGGATFLNRTALAVALVWVVDLIVLLTALAVNAAGDENDE